MLQRVNFQDHWDTIRPMVNLLIVNTGIRMEDVYYLLKSNKATLFMAEDVFLILQELFDGCGNKKLHVFMSHELSNEGYSKLHKYQDQMDEIAKSIGATQITFETDRKGFERSLPSGWKMRYIFERRV